MKTVNELLDQLKEKQSIPSDYKLALYLGVAQGSVQNWRHGRSLPDQKAITRIASELALDADVLLLEIESQRAGNDFAKAAWMRIAQRLQAGIAHAGVAMLVAIVSIAGFAPNAEATALSGAKLLASVCILCKVTLRRWTRSLQALSLRKKIVGFVKGNHVQSADTDAAYLNAA